MGNVERSNVLCLEDVMEYCLAYVQLPIQSVPVDQPLGTKHVKLPPCVIRKLPRVLYINGYTVLHVNLQTCVTRKTATLYYT